MVKANIKIRSKTENRCDEMESNRYSSNSIGATRLVHDNHHGELDGNKGTTIVTPSNKLGLVATDSPT